MSDTNPFLGEPESFDPAPGVPEAEGTATEQPEEQPQRSYLELDDDVANRYVRVKVDGEELEVPLGEALKGYSRTADYTRKTQELAQQRQAAEYALSVERALATQPQLTLQLLAQQYGVSLGPPDQGGASPPDEDDDFDDPYVDPVERRLVQMERRQAALDQAEAQRQADMQLRSAVGAIQQRYQLSQADVTEVVSTALQHNMGPESFEMIWKNIAFDRAQNARQQALAQQQATAAQRQVAAQNAQQLIGSGPSATRAGTQPVPASDGPMTIAQAFELAERQHGVNI